MKEKKRLPILLGILFVAITVTVGVSFAIWQITLQQESTNVITTGCFEVTFTDANPINLEKAYPITDAEGESLVPYEFTITNTCDGLASYQINLEVLNATTLTDLSYVKSALNESTKTISSKLLTTNETVTKTLIDATTSYKLETGYLNANESKTYNLRLWLDENTPTEDTYMNKTLESKITIVTSYLNEIPKTTSEKNVEYIKSKATSEMIVEDDETIDHNLRYIGANPSNYVYFNCDDPTNPTRATCELWRVIGVMNNIDNGTGTKESRIKLIRNESIGKYSWDTSENVNGGYGINEWSQADVMKLLNPEYDAESVGGSLYWNRGSGNCYNGSNNATTCDFTTSGLKENAKSMIGEAVWNTGSNGTEANYDNILISKFYELERSTNTGKICTSWAFCNDTTERTTTWTGYVGLMYPSDHGYATSGGITTNRETCLNTKLYNWNGSSVSDCASNDWLLKSDTLQWTLSPASDSLLASSDSSYASFTFFVHSSGRVDSYISSMTYDLSPVLYLKANVKIVSGEGTSQSPFVLSEE